MGVKPPCYWDIETMIEPDAGHKQSRRERTLPQSGQRPRLVVFQLQHALEVQKINFDPLSDRYQRMPLLISSTRTSHHDAADAQAARAQPLVFIALCPGSLAEDRRL